MGGQTEEEAKEEARELLRLKKKQRKLLEEENELLKEKIEALEQKLTNILKEAHERC